MSLKERLKKALNNRTEQQLVEAHRFEVEREEELFSQLYLDNKVKNGTVETHKSYSTIPKFYFALPKENETIKVRIIFLPEQL